jgi:hypothetical protein
MATGEVGRDGGEKAKGEGRMKREEWGGDA